MFFFFVKEWVMTAYVWTRNMTNLIPLLWMRFRTLVMVTLYLEHYIHVKSLLPFPHHHIVLADVGGLIYLFVEAGLFGI